jgi:hypothetical protein
VVLNNSKNWQIKIMNKAVKNLFWPLATRSIASITLREKDGAIKFISIDVNKNFKTTAPND